MIQNRRVAGGCRQLFSLLGEGQGLFAIIRTPDRDHLVVGGRCLPSAGVSQVPYFDTVSHQLFQIAVQSAAVGTVYVGKHRNACLHGIWREHDHFVFGDGSNLVQSALLSRTRRQIGEPTRACRIHVAREQIITGDIAVEHFACIQLNLKNIRQGCLIQGHNLQLILRSNFDCLFQFTAQRLITLCRYRADQNQTQQHSYQQPNLVDCHSHSVLSLDR